MKVWQKISVFLAMLVLCFGMINMPVSAATNTQDGLKVTLTTDKDTYSQSDEIKVNISVENTNSFDVNNVSLESIIPDGLELKKDYSSSVAIGTLAAGDSYKCELVLQKSGESVPVEDDENADSEDLGEGTSTTENQSSQTSTSIDKNSINQNEKANESDSVQTGDFTSIIPVSIVLVVSAAIIIFLLHKKRNRIFLFFLGIVGSALLFNNGVIDSKAAETVNQRNISVNEIIQVGNNKYELQVNVNYEWVNNQDDEDSEIIQLTIDQSDFTTEEKEVTLSGFYTGNVTEITYENIPGDESYGVISGGKISFADNKWSLELNTLETGENNITISAVNNEGENATVSIQIILNGLYEYSQADIVTDESTGATYVDNILLVFFENGLSIDEQMDIIDSVSGKIVGSENMINQLQVRIPNTDYTGMKEAIDTLESIDGVICATVDAAGYIDMQTNGEEPEFTYPADGKTDYQNLAWWYDDIGANYLPIYDEASIDIGIVDGGFDFSHEDLQLTNINDPFSDSHGTHVAGVIGAKNNGIGINGIAPNHNIYCYSVYTYEDQSGLTPEEKDMIADSRALSGVLKSINSGAKVVNLSFGSGESANREKKYTHGKEWSAYIYTFINAGFDFLLVESAGNEGIDAASAAYLAMIDGDNCVTSSDISMEDILNKTVIVGSAEQNDSGEYQLSDFSNGGERVSITAPGRGIFSTIVNGYDFDTGTSMAAPMVTGAIAGIWEIDPSMTSKEVRDLVLNSASNIVSNNPDTPNASDNHRTSYPLLNIQAAVEKLYGSVTGQVVSEDQIPLDYVSVELFNSDNKKVTSGYTDENGNFSFSLPEGTFTIRFIKSGFETREMSVDISYQTITALLDPVVLNERSVGIQGNVVDETGSAISNVNVEIKDSNSDEEIASTSTDENGDFFVALENGEYKITFTKEGYESVTRDNIIVFDGTFTMRKIVLSKNQDTTLLKGTYIDAKHGNVAAILSDGSLWTWGSNGRGQLGNGTFVDSSFPVKIMDNVVKVSIGYEYMAAIKTDGSLWTWGGNAYGKLGNGKTEDCATPEKIMDNVIDVSLGDYHSAAVTADGSLWTWGGDDNGRLGNGEDYMDSYVPTKIMDNVESVCLGVYQSAAITRDGNLWMWGGGILGTGTVNEPSGIPIKILENVKSVYLSDTNLPCSAAILEDGSLWTWGDNNAGRLGQGTPPGKYYPVDSYVPVKILDNITDFCWGDHYGAAISNDGSLWVMGYSGDVLWDIEYVDRDVPTNAMSGVSDISIGNFNCIAIMEDGNIYTWGSNYSGQLGVGKTYSELKESDTLINIMDQFNL